jgi:hypothetical protein
MTTTKPMPLILTPLQHAQLRARLDNLLDYLEVERNRSNDETAHAHSYGRR